MTESTTPGPGWPLWARLLTLTAVVVAVISTAVAVYVLRRPSEEAVWTLCTDGPDLDERLTACLSTVERVESRQAPPELIAAAYHNLGIVQMDKGLTDEALLSLSKSVRLNPEDSTSLATRAQLYVERDDPVNATKDYDSAIEADPANFNALFGRASLYAVAGYDEGAIQDWSEGLKYVKDQASLNPLENLGHAHFRRQDYDRALEFYARALEIDPQDPPALFGRGAARLATGENAAGLGDVAAAMKLETGIGERMAALGVKATAYADNEPPPFAGAAFTIGIVDDLGLTVPDHPNNLTAADIIAVRTAPDERGQGMIAFTFTPEGDAKMQALTTENMGRTLGFMIDGGVEPSASARIDSVVSQGAQLGFPSVADAEAFIKRLTESRQP